MNKGELRLRLSPEYSRAILDTAQRQFGDGVAVWLFGSRVVDARRGGDIDLLVDVPHPIENKPREAARFVAALQSQLGDQKIDVVIDDHRNPLAIHEAARREGLELKCQVT